jgi:hypothetical protein
MLAHLRGDAHRSLGSIAGVEFVDHPGGRSQVALHLESSSPEVVEALCRDGDTLEVGEPSSTASDGMK